MISVFTAVREKRGACPKPWVLTGCSHETEKHGDKTQLMQIYPN